MSRMRFGVHPLLEEESNRLIRESMKGVTSHEAKRDVLTPWKEKDRLSKEVYSASGVADPAIRKGVFGRVANKSAPHLNSVEGKVPPMGRTSEGARGGRADRSVSLRQFVEDQKA